MEFDVTKFDVAKFDSILARGLSNGVGVPDGQMCIEAAICATLGLPHGDDPDCVANSVRTFKIALNDSLWSSESARAKGLRDLGLAQLGSAGIVSGADFSKRIAKKTIRILIPKLFREIFPGNPTCLVAANRCEKKGTARAEAESAAWAAKAAARAAKAAAWAEARAAAESAAWAAKAAARAEAESAAESAAWAAAWAAKAAKAAPTGPADDRYLILSANLALETLRELESPGIALL